MLVLIAIELPVVMFAAPAAPLTGVVTDGMKLFNTLKASRRNCTWRPPPRFTLRANDRSSVWSLHPSNRFEPDSFPTLQWHGDTFDLPHGATLLAGSPAYPHQAFRVGDKAYGVQFHLEVSDSMADEWGRIEESLFLDIIKTSQTGACAG